jgi:nucleotide-binding universal stress UspA family protein
VSLCSTLEHFLSCLSFSKMLVCVAVDVSTEIVGPAIERAVGMGRAVAGSRGRVLILSVVKKESEVEEVEKRLKKLCRNVPGSSDECSILVGGDRDAGKTLVSFVDSFAPHVLVVARSDKTWIESVLLGSCAQYVLANAKCNVLIAK